MTKNETFVIECTMNDRWIPHFISALKYMEYCGNIGKSREVSIFADGDGNFQPKFKFPNHVKNDVAPARDDKGNRLYDAG